MPNEMSLARTFHAMGDPTRLEILSRLAEVPLPVKKLSAGSGMALPSFLRHLRILEEARLIKTEKEGRNRICRLEAEGLAAARAWIEQTRAEWSARLDNLDKLLSTPKH